jgi:hypothetical protein
MCLTVGGVAIRKGISAFFVLNKSRTDAAESAIRQSFWAGSNYYCYPKL